MSAILFALLDDPALGTLQCTTAGAFVCDALSANVTFKGVAAQTVICLASGVFGTPVIPCTKAPPVFPAPCATFAPALSMSIRVLVEGKAPVTAMMPQFAMENGIPAVIPITKSTTVKVL